jgi:mRNA interferase MazF
LGQRLKKTRPAIIVSDDLLGKLPLKIIVPITDWKERYEIAPWMIRIAPNSINGLSKDSSDDCFQIRSVSQERFVKRLGYTSEIIMEEIKIGLSKVLSIEN